MAYTIPLYWLIYNHALRYWNAYIFERINLGSYKATPRCFWFMNKYVFMNNTWIVNILKTKKTCRHDFHKYICHSSLKNQKCVNHFVTNTMFFISRERLKVYRYKYYSFYLSEYSKYFIWLKNLLNIYPFELSMNYSHPTHCKINYTSFWIISTNKLNLSSTYL